MKLLLDMNVSPTWVSVLAAEGYEARHWSSIGRGDAPDQELFDWAKRKNHIVFTHDLDFGAILAATNAEGPSVFQVRSQDIHPKTSAKLVIETLKRFKNQLEQGALVSVDRERSRARVLPLG
jgi:predicted nuclease of predicted toxin-antitoxin system